MSSLTLSMELLHIIVGARTPPQEEVINMLKDRFTNRYQSEPQVANDDNTPLDEDTSGNYKSNEQQPEGGEGGRNLQSNDSNNG